MTTRNLRTLAATFMSLVLVGLALAAPAQADRNITPRFTANEKGDIVHTGNTLMTCPASAAGCSTAQNGTATGGALNNNNYSMVYVDVDSDAATFNSSTANLTLPAGAEILFAGLYYSGNTASGGEAARATTLMDSPAAGGYITVTADQIDDFNSSDANQHIYGGFADITSLVAAGGSGDYTVANVQAATGTDHHAGWAMVIAYRSNDEAPRNLTVFDGLVGINPNEPDKTLTLTGFQTSPAGAINADIGLIVWEGDRGLLGDQVLFDGSPFTDANNPATNFNNSTISFKGSTFTDKTPNYDNQMGYDNDLLTADGLLTNNQTSANLSLRTTGDRWVPQVVTFAPDIYSPNIPLQKSATDVNGGLLLAGDEVEYRISGTNIGQETARDLIVTDPIPAGMTFVPGSLREVVGANTGSKTDASGDDQAEYQSGLNRTRFRVGTGANSTTGGRLAQNENFEVRFRARIDAGTAPGTVISNVATADYSGDQTGIDYTVQTDPTNVTSDPRPEIAIDKTGPAGVQHGGNLTYGFDVTNPGEAPLSGVAVTDPGCAPVTGPVKTGGDQDNLLEPGETWTYACTKPVPAHAPGEADPIVNTASASGTYNGVTVNDNDQVSTDLQHPSIDIDTTGPATVAHGQPITYSYVVTTAGDVPVGGVAVTDPSCSPVTGPVKTGGNQDNLLEPGETWTYSCTTATIPAHAPGEADPIQNTGSVSGTAAGSPVSDSDPHSVDVVHPGINVAKTGPASAAHGDTMTFSYAVTSTGDAPLSNVGVTDNVCAPVTGPVKTGGNQDNLLEAGETWTFGCQRTPPAHTAAEADPFVNVATATGTASGATVTDTDQHSTDITHPDDADLAIDKTAPANVAAGGRIAYMLDVSNLGPGTTAGVVVTDTLPAGTTFVPAASSATCSAAGQTVTCTAPSIAPGQILSFTVAADTSLALAGTTITNAASVTADGDDANPNNNQDTANTTVGQAADLEITKTAPTPAQSGGQLVFTMVVTNNGPSAATNVEVTDPVPAGVDYVSAVPSQGMCSQSMGTVTCDLGTIASGAAAQILLTVQVPNALAGTSFTNTATVDGDQPDPVPGNNTDDAQVNVVSGAGARADLKVVKTITNGFARVGNNLTYRISVTNQGPDPATDVNVTDTLNASVELVSVASDRGTCTASLPVSCALGRMASGETAQITVVVKLLTEGKLVNVATATSPETDPNPADNSDDAIANVDSSRTTATLRKVASKRKLRPGQRFAYLITFTNTGNSPANKVKVCDPLPRRLIFVSASDSGVYDPATRTVCWTRDSVAPGASWQLTLNVRGTRNVAKVRKVKNVVTATGSNFTQLQAAAYINCGKTITQ